VKPGSLILENRAKMANALLAVTDRRAEKADNAVVRKTYDKLRGAAQKHVETAAPRVAQLVDKYADV
jgi:hypothetical protein